ncbi:ankyrin-2-like [Mizuhopecten yessoensis]|uniref:ankyrin-2-like n=1 Tax=Mizuhopecten yessoensis TaxID=6573 RepID=UPI000B45DC78|nr:ankyrin-2-like [Mizuhopecten yessoensis]
MNTDKSSDESSYCLIATGNDKRTKKRSGIIHLYVDTVILDHTQVSYVPKPPFRKKRKSIASGRGKPYTRSPRIDSDVNVTFLIENNIDTTRQESKEDIRRSLQTHTQERGRINSPEFLEQCILVSVDITGASSPTEPSALCLAERIESFLREGDIRLTDEANTKLKIKTEDIRIIIKNQTTDGFPIVCISQAEYFADERTVVVMHCTILACPPATSVRWVRIRYGEEEELDIDNYKYLGGGVLSPSLVITDVSYTDEGYYRCYVTSSEGEGKSNTTWLETNSDYTDLSTFLHQNGHDKVDSSAIRCIKTYLASNRTSGDDVPLLRIAIDNNSRDLLRYIISTVPEVLSSRDVDGCTSLHYCCQYGTLSLFKLLIESGMSAERTTSNGSTCLMMATLNRHRQVLQHILENFPEQLNVVNSDGRNCLLMSCEKDNIHIFELLVKTGISLEHKDKAGNTCLMTAIVYRNNCLAHFIAENYTKQHDDSDGLNALMLCCRVGNIETFKFLIVTWMDSDPIFDKGMTCLMVAVMHQQRRLAKYIAAVLPNQLHLRNNDGWDALVFCSMYGDIELFEFLIKQGMNPPTQTQDGLSCLMIAVRNKQIEMTKHIVKSYPRHLHHRDRNGLNVLYHCCHSGNVELFQYLVEKGLKPNTCTSDGSTCLMISVQNKHFDLIRHIGGKYPEQLEEEDKRGWNVLLYCCEAGEVRVFEYLVEKGAKTDTCSLDGSTCLMIAVQNKHFDLSRHIGDKYPKQLGEEDTRGWNVLLYCCEAGDVKIFDYLVEKRAKTDTCSPGGSTCLMIAVLNKHFDLIRHIVDKYPEQLDEEDIRGWNALFYCCEVGEVRIFDDLVKKGAKPDTCSLDETTCLMIAALNNHVDLTRSIGDKYPKQLDKRNTTGWDALLCCCKAGDVKIFDYLVGKGLKPQTCSNDGSTCLMIAAANKQFDLAQHIVVRHPELLEQRDQNGWNALLYCCQAGDVSMFKFLVEKGLKPDSSSTCLMIAVLNNHFEQCRHILDHTTPEHRYRDGWDILLCCCQAGNVKIFDYLVENAVQPATHSDNGSTYLMIAILNKQFDLTQHIVEKYPEQLNKLNRNGWNALLCCCQVGDFRIFKYLVKKGLKPDTRSKEGSTCLMIAVLNKRFNLIKHIVKEYQEQLEQLDNNGWNALLYCCEAGEVRIFDYLVGKGVKPDTRSTDGLTCLMMAVLNKHFDLTRHIGDKYPEQLEQRDTQGWDVLLCCYKAGDVRIFDYLVEKGARSDTRSTDVSTCLKIAVLNKHFDLIRHIEDKYPERLERRNMSGTDLPLRFCKAGVVRILDILVGKE